LRPFEVILAFLSLEFFGLTSVFRFTSRYPEVICRFFGVLLLLTLFGLAAMEAALATLMIQDSQNKLCIAYNLSDPLCAHLEDDAYRAGQEPGLSSNSDASPDAAQQARVPPPDSAGQNQAAGTDDATNPDPDGTKQQIAALAAEAVKTLRYVKWIVIAVSLLLPFAYLIVGLAFDFFEELVQPALAIVRSLLFAVAYIASILLSRLIVSASIILRGLLRIFTLPVVLILRAQQLFTPSTGGNDKTG